MSATFLVALVVSAAVSALGQMLLRRYPSAVVRTLVVVAFAIGVLSFTLTRDLDSQSGRAESGGFTLGMVAAGLVGAFVFPPKRR